MKVGTVDKIMNLWKIPLLLELLSLVCNVKGQQVLTEDEQEEILAAHNYYRSLVDPIATDMLRLVSPIQWAIIIGALS